MTVPPMRTGFVGACACFRGLHRRLHLRDSKLRGARSCVGNGEGGGRGLCDERGGNPSRASICQRGGAWCHMFMRCVPLAPLVATVLITDRGDGGQVLRRRLGQTNQRTECAQESRGRGLRLVKPAKTECMPACHAGGSACGLRSSQCPGGVVFTGYAPATSSPSKNSFLWCYKRGLEQPLQEQSPCSSALTARQPRL